MNLKPLNPESAAVGDPPVTELLEVVEDAIFRLLPRQPRTVAQHGKPAVAVLDRTRLVRLDVAQLVAPATRLYPVEHEMEDANLDAVDNVLSS